ncbi:MAG: GerMN domain-containing protein [Thermosynechococcaceae cyanobacterium]
MIKPRMRIFGVFFGILLMALPFGLVGCLETKTPSDGSSSVSPTPSETVSPTPEPSEAASSSPTAEPTEVKAEVYWLQSTANKLELTPAQVKLSANDSSSEAQLTAALERLLQGPANSDVTSSIPAETKLNTLKVEADGVHVDLSKAFTSGGGSTSMQGRLGQVIYTASSLNPAKPVWLSIDGEPLKTLGGEGLEVSQPMTRQEFDKNFSL